MHVHHKYMTHNSTMHAHDPHLSFSLLAVCLQYSVIYCAIYIMTHSLGMYFIDSVLPFHFTVLYLFNIQ